MCPGGQRRHCRCYQQYPQDRQRRRLSLSPRVAEKDARTRAQERWTRGTACAEAWRRMTGLGRGNQWGTRAERDMAGGRHCRPEHGQTHAKCWVSRGSEGKGCLACLNVFIQRTHLPREYTPAAHSAGRPEKRRRVQSRLESTRLSWVGARFPLMAFVHCQAN